jgi:hypothetical protein
LQVMSLYRLSPVVEEEPPQSYFGSLLNLSGLNL